MTYEYHNDAGHGWLKVPFAELRALGVDNISGFSYQDSLFAYLEEDCDADKFTRAYEQKYGCKPVITEHYDGDNSPIRFKNRF